MTRAARSPARWGLAVLLVAALAGPSTGTAAADDTQAHSYPGPSYSAEFTGSPTEFENQSKLWFYADAWWALLVEPGGRSLRVFELMPDHTWRPTTAVVNSAVGAVGDALPDGDTVHVLTRGIDDSLLYVRLTFEPATRDYRVAAPSLVTTRKSSAPATIAKDAAGTLWAGYATAASTVVTYSVDGGLTWGRVITLSTSAPGSTPESGQLIAYNDRVGMLWSDQETGSFRFASHHTGDDPTLWSTEVAASGLGVADNHVSVVRVPAEDLAQVPTGTSDALVAAVKTSRGDTAGNNTAPLIEVLIRDTTGQWSVVPASTVAEGLNDPVIAVDAATHTLRLFATHNGAIIMKTAPLDHLAFPPGVGSVFVNGSSSILGNPTVSKQPLDARSGLVVLASDTVKFTYRHAELALGPATTAPDPNDVTPPTPPGDLRVRATSPESVVLSWQAAHDGTRWVPGASGVPVAGYVVTRNGAEVTTVTDTSFEDRARASQNAAEPTSVEYSVVAVDAAGNRSTPVTTVVELPGSKQSPVPGYVALALLGLAALIAMAYLLHRHQVARRTRVPGVPDSTPSEPPSRAPVA